MARKIRKDGSMLWVRETANAVSLKKRPVLLVICEDITEQKRAEEAARRSERELREVVETIPAMVWAAAPDGSNAFVNKRWEEYTGLSAEQTAGSGWLPALHPDDVQGYVQKWQDSAARGVPFEHEARFRSAAEGEYRWFLSHGVPLRDEQGNIVKWFGIVTDITERKRGEEAVRRSEKELQQVVATIPAWVFVARPDGFMELNSPGWLEYSGISAEQSSPGGWIAAIHPDDVDVHVNKWQDSLSSGKPFENEARHRSKNGEYRWFLIRVVPLRDEQENILKWYGTVTDIEDRKRAEALLIGEKRILEMVATGEPLAEILDGLCRLAEEQAPGVLASVLLLDGNCLRHGAAPSLPAAYTDAIDGVAIGPCVGSCGTAAYSGKQVIVEDIATDPLWADYRDAALPHSLRACWSTPIFSSQQRRVIGTFAMYYREPRTPILRDQAVIEQITHLAGAAIDHKLTQEELRRSETCLAEAQKLTNTGSFVFHPTTKQALYLSDEWYRIYGFDPESDGRRWKQQPGWEEWLQRIHPQDRNKVLEIIDQAIRQKSDHEVEYRAVLPNGVTKYLYALSHSILNSAGDVVQIMGSVTDVTERKHAEQERERLRQLQADLAHINRVSMMGELAASIGHEIKQPIAAAITNANTCLRWLKRDNPDLGEARDAASRVIEDAMRSVEIINRTSSLYRKEETQREPVNMNAIIGDIVGLLRNEAGRQGVSIRTELAGGCVEVMGDRVQLQQVLMNLIINGIDAMKTVDGLREITLSSERDSTAQLVVAVSDTGVGLPPQTDQVFNAFFTTKPHGTGMGLAISRTIVESHGGRLSAKPNTGGGATFYFTLPLTAEAAA
jgi:PAS domain S-box-containing protein